MIRRVTSRFNALSAVVPKRTALVVVNDKKQGNGAGKKEGNHSPKHQQNQQQQAPREQVKSATSINTSNSHIDFEPTPTNFDDIIIIAEPANAPVQQQRHHQHHHRDHSHRFESKHKNQQAQVAAVPAATIAPATPTAYQGIAQEPFSKEATDVLLGEIDPADVEIKPDGTVYMPEIKYRRRLNHAFGPGAWAMKPVGSAVLTEDLLSRTYQLFWYVYTAFLQPFHFFRFFLVTHNASCRTNTALVDLSPKQLASNACVMV
jgi:hypothetical protein